jgi:hypothetical protein
MGETTVSKTPVKPELTKLAPPEKRRRYIFPVGEVVIDNVTALCVRPSGTHRLETADGKKFIVNPGWLAVELDVESWTL